MPVTLRIVFTQGEDEFEIRAGQLFQAERMSSEATALLTRVCRNTRPHLGNGGRFTRIYRASFA